MLHRVAAGLALLQGAYMLADGAHRLTSGAYFGNALGPWGSLLARLGIDPVAASTAEAFVAFGVLWIAAAAALALARAPYAVAVLAIATIWYLPVGTVISAFVLIVTLLRGRK